MGKWSKERSGERLKMESETAGTREQWLHFGCVSWRAKSSLYQQLFNFLSCMREIHHAICKQNKLIIRPVIKWREFRGNKKNCDNSDLLCKTHARLMQDSCNSLNWSRTRKSPFFKFIRPDFWMDGKGYFLHASSHSENVASARRLDCCLFYSLDLQQTLTLSKQNLKTFLGKSVHACSYNNIILHMYSKTEQA